MSLDEMVCARCKQPMIIQRLDNMPLCGACEQLFRKEAAQKLASRKGRENRPKMDMKGMRYVLGK